MLEFDVVIAGGGPAGLEAALMLGRARRRVLLCDTGEPRNAPAAAAHGVFTRDGTPPGDILRIAREQLTPYTTVRLAAVAVADAAPHAYGFTVTLGDGQAVRARKLLVATGVRDELPAVEGMRALWGRGVYHCPYCHAFELADRPLAVYGRGPQALELAGLLTNWTSTVTLLTGGPAGWSESERRHVHAAGFQVVETPVTRLDRATPDEVRVAFAGGHEAAFGGVFLRPTLRQRTDIPARLGCSLDERNLVLVDEQKQSNIPGLYVAGDPSNAVQSVLLAAASGATAAMAINAALTAEDVQGRRARHTKPSPAMCGDFLPSTSRAWGAPG